MTRGRARRWWPVAAMVLAFAAGTAPALAAPPGDTVTYKVRPGDSLGLIAAEYYGDRGHAVFIMTANRMPHGRKLKPGEKLKIPVNRDITTKPGDSFQSLAETYLDDGRRGPFLAEFNNMDPASSLPAGTPITIPFHVTHVAADNESLAQIAAAYFRDAKRAAMLRDYNFLDRDAIAKGESIVVPIYTVRVRASKQPTGDAESKARSDKLDSMRIHARTALPRARTAARAGDFASVKAELAPIDLDYVDAAVAVEVGILLGTAHVAFADEALADATFKRVLERRPNHVLDAYHHAPKVRAAWQKAGGAVEAGAK